MGGINAKEKNMTLESQVCSLELAKRLRELGVKQNGYFTWGERKGKPFIGDEVPYFSCDIPIASAFTVAELGEILPESFIYGGAEMLVILFKDRAEYLRKETNKLVHEVRAEIEADARALLLIYLLENQLIKLED